MENTKLNKIEVPPALTRLAAIIWQVVEDEMKREGDNETDEAMNE